MWEMLDKTLSPHFQAFSLTNVPLCLCLYAAPPHFQEGKKIKETKSSLQNSLVFIIKGDTQAKSIWILNWIIS